MKTSTPVKGTTITSKKRSLVHKDKTFISLEENEGTLESEIKSRRLEAINKSAEVRRSIAAPLLDVQHYKDCIKLSAENKINSKNAFSLLLIDLMAAMTKKKDSEINQNFQVASCTLDASVKIYGYRVDAVHTDVMKIAVGFTNKEAQKADNEEGEGNVSQEEEGEVRLKTKKKKKKMTIVKPETLNSKNDNDIVLDVVPRQNLLAQKVDANDLLIKIPKFNDSSAFIIDPDFPVWPFDGNENIVPHVDKEQTCDISDLMKDFLNHSVSEKERICNVYADFQFGKDYDDENSDNEMDISRESGNFEFDVNASVADDLGTSVDNVILSENRSQNTGGKLSVPVGGYESGEEIVVANACEQQRVNPVKIVDMKKRISKNHLEYSLFDSNVFKSWAGPTYWKIKPTLNKKTLVDGNKENEDSSKPVASKRTRKGKILPSVGLFEVNVETLAKYLASGDRSTLAKGTLLNWSPNNTTMPKDCMYKSKYLFSLFHIPSIIIEPNINGEDIDDSLGKSDVGCNDDEDIDNNEELDYCSNLTINDGAELECPNVSTMEVGDNAEPSIGQWDQANMVAVPNKVEKITVSQFKRTKHIDIKHLKKSIWNVLLNPGNTEQVNFTENSKMNTTISFKDLLRLYPQRLPSHLALNLSAPLVFNALLHLTNEKCLNLQQKKEEKKIDFNISQ